METKRIVMWAGAALAVLAVVTGAQAQNGVLHPTPVSHSYLCFEGDSAGEVMKKANEAGARGWKLVAATDSVWCFEQLSAVRPRAIRESF